MRKTILIGILVLLPAAILGGVSLISCSKLECSTGTHEESGKCVANLESTCGPGTYSYAGQCVRTEGPVCGDNTTLDVDAGVCVGGGGGQTGQLRGGRWTNVNMLKPESITTIANLMLPDNFQQGVFVILLRTETAGGHTFLHGGDGVKMSDNPLMYSFKEGFDPDPAVPCTLGDADVNDGGMPKTPFETSGPFHMSFVFVGNASDIEPPLYIWKAKITGTLDADGIPVANDPSIAQGGGGTLTGCFTAHGEPGRAGAADIYIKDLYQTVLELIQSSGGAVDDDCTGSGSNDGFAFEIQWESNEITDLTIDPGDAGVTQTDAQ